MPTVLVVDDDDDQRELLAICMREHACVVDASSGEQARALLGAVRIDALIASIEAPGVVEFIDSLRDTPVVLIATAWTERMLRYAHEVRASILQRPHDILDVIHASVAASAK
ncbi:response regulator [Sandaracinus amylolyticus]|uniref:response regulator n=1 Tax=Sandaracinus amylolyticus TaxID=927083 RepID=UPI0012ED41B4|nr:response regulator [Sandaracinus amylolyticus]